MTIRRSSCFRNVVLVVGLIWITPALAGPPPQILRVQIGGKRLKNLIRRGGLVFPSLWVYNAKRQLVFRFEGDHKDLVGALSRVWADPRPIAGPPLTRWVFPHQLHILNKNSRTPEWVFVETWASWDPACLREKRALVSFLAGHGMGLADLVLIRMGTLDPALNTVHRRLREER